MKVIISVRDEESWMRSMELTLLHRRSDPTASKDTLMPPLVKTYHKYCRANHFARNRRQFFSDYNLLVRDAVPGERCLEFEMRNGWI